MGYSLLLDLMLVVAAILIFPVTLWVALRIVEKVRIAQFKGVTAKNVIKASVFFYLMYLCLYFAFIVLMVLLGVLLKLAGLPVALVIGPALILGLGLIVLMFYVYHKVLRRYFQAKFPITLLVWFIQYMIGTVVMCVTLGLLGLLFFAGRFI